MAAELKPCPFCGGPNIERHADGVIECCDCGATVQDDLIWNSRREPIAPHGVTPCDGSKP
jgi:ribosomal protein L37AE/L43A